VGVAESSLTIVVETDPSSVFDRSVEWEGLADAPPAAPPLLGGRI
jgi:hypothetical protein